MNCFIPPLPGQNMMYMCTKCRNRFSHEVPKPVLGIFTPQVKCPVCGAKAAADPGVKY